MVDYEKYAQKYKRGPKAFKYVKVLAGKCGLSLTEFLKRAKTSKCIVYNWRDDKYAVRTDILMRFVKVAVEMGVEP